MAGQLVVIYGPPLAGKTTAARDLARSLDGKTVVVGIEDHLLGAIALPDPDWRAELDMVHTQLRLLVANYLKNGYHVVVEGAYVYERDGALQDYEAEIDQLLALMRHLTSQALIVKLSAAPAVLAKRARLTGRDDEAGAAQRIGASYRGRYGLRFLAIDTGEQDRDGVADSIKALLGSGVA